MSTLLILDNNDRKKVKKKKLVKYKKRVKKNVKYKKHKVDKILSDFFTGEQKKKEKSDNLPWIEKYRPSTLDKVTSHKNIIQTLDKFICDGSLPHLLFYGPPGTGKTSTIIACAKKLYLNNYPYMVLEFNASDERGVDIVRDKIKTFVSSKNFFGKGYKLVILDEIDAMTYDAQKILRQVIEKYSGNARFCLICNYVSKIIHALRSRCTKFRFSPLKDVEIEKHLNIIREKENISATKDGMNSIVKLCCGDMRKALNIMQSTFMTFGEITEKNVYCASNSYKQTDIKKILGWIETLDFAKAYDKIFGFKYKRGLMLKKMFSDIADYFVNYEMDIDNKIMLYDKLANIECNEVVTSNDRIQLGAVIGIIKLFVY